MVNAQIGQETTELFSITNESDAKLSWTIVGAAIARGAHCFVI